MNVTLYKLTNKETNLTSQSRNDAMILKLDNPITMTGYSTYVKGNDLVESVFYESPKYILEIMYIEKIKYSINT